MRGASRGPSRWRDCGIYARGSGAGSRMLDGVSHVHISIHPVQCLSDRSRDGAGGRGDKTRTETPEHAARSRLYKRALLLEEFRADAR